MYKPVRIQSSYKENDLGESIYEVVLNLEPEKIVEFSPLHGYSTVAMAMALRDLGQGHIYSYDIWENYRFNKPDFQSTQDNIKSYGLEDYVTFGYKDYYDWLDEGDDFDLLHLDISNTGDIIETTFNKLQSKLKQGSAILFEGGSEERDQVEWISKYNKMPINSVKDKVPYTIINAKFPSISLIKY